MIVSPLRVANYRGLSEGERTAGPVTLPAVTNPAGLRRHGRGRNEAFANAFHGLAMKLPLLITASHFNFARDGGAGAEIYNNKKITAHELKPVSGYKFDLVFVFILIFLLI